MMTNTARNFTKTSKPTRMSDIGSHSEDGMITRAQHFDNAKRRRKADRAAERVAKRNWE